MAMFRVSAAAVVVLVGGLSAAWTGGVRAEFHWHRTTRRCCLPNYGYGHDTPRFRASNFAVAHSATGSQAAYHKSFHFRATALEVDHLRLEQIGLAIYPHTGQLLASGKMTHRGDLDGLKGNNVTIRIRAYVAASADAFQIPPDAHVVWQAEHRLWVTAGGPHAVLLAPPSGQLPQPEKLAIHFDRITHLEVEMDYQRDR